MATATGVTLFTAIFDDVDDGVTNGAVVDVVGVDVDLAGATPAALFFSSIWTGFGASSSTIFYAGSTTVVFDSSFFSSSTTGA